jgi:tyrosyl-tRNA synthetase
MFGTSKTKPVINEQDIDELLSRGVENIFPHKDFIKTKMMKGEKISLYLGIDPTAPTLHIGHTIPLRKLGIFQRLGHEVVLLIGDFTAMIGDPTDKTATRKKLSRDEVLENLKQYQKQASRFISFTGENKALIKYNSEWFGQMTFAEVLELESHMTVDQMLKRDMFQKRSEEGKAIYMHEFMYPLMQGYDSVAMDVDGEIGGNDQTFNMLTGRDLMKELKQKEKFVIATKLLVDATGKKMGKSEGNMVALDQTPEDMFGKIMSWPDTLIVLGFELLTGVSVLEIKEIQKKLDNGENPKESKMRLAREIITTCHDVESAERAQKAFEHIFADGGVPEDILKVNASQHDYLVNILLEHHLISSKTEWKRLVTDGAVTEIQSDTKITNIEETVPEGVLVYKIGKRRFIKIEVK